MKSILAVDDSASIRRMVSFTLRTAGFDVTEAVDGADGLSKAVGKPFDLVLTDLHMPRMDGITLIGKLRAMPAYAHAPILMLSTESSDAMKAKGQQVGATDWLVKPFEPQKLVAVVKRVLG